MILADKIIYLRKKAGWSGNGIQEGDNGGGFLLYEAGKRKCPKEGSGIFSAVSTCYWLLVTAVFLFVCFGPYGNAKPQYYWVVWAIAGVIYGAVAVVLKAIYRKGA